MPSKAARAIAKLHRPHKPHGACHYAHDVNHNRESVDSAGIEYHGIAEAHIPMLAYGNTSSAYARSLLRLLAS